MAHCGKVVSVSGIQLQPSLGWNTLGQSIHQFMNRIVMKYYLTKNYHEVRTQR